VGWDWVHLVPATTGLLYQPQMIDDGDCGAIGGMKICRGNRSTRRKPASVPLCPPQIPHDQTPGSNPGRRGGKPATNRLSYDTAMTLPLKSKWVSRALLKSFTSMYGYYTPYVTSGDFKMRNIQIVVLWVTASHSLTCITSRKPPLVVSILREDDMKDVGSFRNVGNPLPDYTVS
jgi:hypothetical protein